MKVELMLLPSPFLRVYLEALEKISGIIVICCQYLECRRLGVGGGVSDSEVESMRQEVSRWEDFLTLVELILVLISVSKYTKVPKYANQQKRYSWQNFQKLFLTMIISCLIFLGCNIKTCIMSSFKRASLEYVSSYFHTSLTITFSFSPSLLFSSQTVNNGNCHLLSIYYVLVTILNSFNPHINFILSVFWMKRLRHREVE